MQGAVDGGGHVPGFWGVVGGGGGGGWGRGGRRGQPPSDYGGGCLTVRGFDVCFLSEAGKLDDALAGFTFLFGFEGGLGGGGGEGGVAHDEGGEVVFSVLCHFQRDVAEGGVEVVGEDFAEAGEGSGAVVFEPVVVEVVVGLVLEFGREDGDGWECAGVQVGGGPPFCVAPSFSAIAGVRVVEVVVCREVPEHRLALREDVVAQEEVVGFLTLAVWVYVSSGGRGRGGRYQGTGCCSSV